MDDSGRRKVTAQRAGPGSGDAPLRRALLTALGAIAALTLVLTLVLPQAHSTVTHYRLIGGTPAHHPGKNAHGKHTTKSQSPAQPRPTAGHGCNFSLTPKATTKPVGRCTVLEVGDSIGNDLGWGLERLIPTDSGLTLAQDDKSSTGLVNTNFWNWPDHLATDLSQTHPQLVIISLGGNEQQGMEVNGSPVQFPAAAWQREYLARVKHFIGEATAAGAYVLWVGEPIMQDPQFSAGARLLNELYARAVSENPNAVFLSTWNLFADAHGRFLAEADVNGQTVALRQPDGIHYSLAGENVVATYVIDQIGKIFHVQLAATTPATITR